MNKEAQQLVKSAENKLNPGFLKSLISSKSSRLEEALDLLEKAGNIYKLNKNWADAGETFYRCGEIEMELGADSANYFQDAAHCFSFVDIERSNEALKKTLQIYTNQGRFQMAGKIQKQMAEKFEEDLEYDKAIEAYKEAADYFSMEKMNSKSYEQGCLIKYCDLLCIRNHKDTYPQAANVIKILN